MRPTGHKAIIFSFLATMCSISILASTLDSIKVDNTYLFYYKITSGQNNSKLLIYLHGGVSQFKEKDSPVQVPPLELLEGNTEFLPVVKEEGYDVIIPIAYNQYNWLEDDGERFVDQLRATYADKYTQVYISGFSDGGTGAFRFFYNAPGKYNGVIVFNGYPQLQNYYKKADHLKAIGKNIIYCSTESDKVIPYEFLLVEFRRQQMVNENTYFLLREGGHAFTSYHQEDFKLCFQLLGKSNMQTTTSAGIIQVYPPVDGFIVDGEVKAIYPFRKKTGKNYSMSSQEYQRDDYNYKDFKKTLADGKQIKVSPTTIDTSDLKKVAYITFPIEIDRKETNIKFINWLSAPTW